MPESMKKTRRTRSLHEESSVSLQVMAIVGRIDCDENTTTNTAEERREVEDDDVMIIQIDNKKKEERRRRE